MFRKLGKDIISCVGRCCNGFEELKETNVMISEVYEKMWEKLDRWGCGMSMVVANASDYKFIELLDKYDIYYIWGYDEDSEIDQMHKESMDEKINKYRGINNKNP
jgi:hypothetical protein